MKNMHSMAKAELDLISDVDMCVFLKKVWERMFRISLKEIVKMTINIYRLIIQKRSKAYQTPRRK